MNDERLIDRIVAGVLEQLGTQTETVPPNASGGVGRTDCQSVRETSLKRAGNEHSASGDGSDGLAIRPTNRAAAAETDGQLVLDDKVITGDLLETRINGRHRLVIGPNTVLTPSARDFLRSREIEWSRADKSDTQRPAGQVWKAIVVQPTPAVESALAEATRTAAVRWERELVATAPEAASMAVSVLCRVEAAGVVVFAEAAEAVACLANRNRRVRAAAINDLRHVESVRETLGANLFCVDPRGRSHFEVRNILKQATAATPCVPKCWNESN
jgi:hypothetical protein